MQLKNRNILVTGGSRGIGKVICEKLASYGANIAFTYSNDSNTALDTFKKLKNYKVDVLKFKCDVRDREKYKIIKSKISKKWKSLDVLVNNAGINKPTDFDKITDKDWDEVLSVNLKGPFVTTQEFIPLLSKGENASIINIGSVSGQYGGPRTAHYAASKAGLISLSQVISRYVSKYGIRCNTISVGLIKSNMANKGLKSKLVRDAANSIILKRFGTMDEVAAAVIFLATNDSSYITGQTINVNGGLYF